MAPVQSGSAQPVGQCPSARGSSAAPFQRSLSVPAELDGAARIVCLARAGLSSIIAGEQNRSVSRAGRAESLSAPTTLSWRISFTARFFLHRDGSRCHNDSNEAFF